jgi:hypothetical protein
MPSETSVLPINFFGVCFELTVCVTPVEVPNNTTSDAAIGNTASKEKQECDCKNAKVFSLWTFTHKEH